MRQLKISNQPTDPAWETEKANALPFLQKLAATRPLGINSSDEEQLLHFVISMAKQYRGQGTPWESLLTAGYETVVKSVELDGSRPRDDKYLSWRMRQGMAAVIKEINL